uniref:MAT1 centre domain-containing protein n=1 Tax=Zonotrichia albicollis TaxID=44394 RepID=A0A8D2MBS8_ZONAL
MMTLDVFSFLVIYLIYVEHKPQILQHFTTQHIVGRTEFKLAFLVMLYRCESCVELLFVRGAGNCHECDTPLRKSNFRVQLFEDPAVDKEVEIRKKVLKIYNKREEDFPTLEEYNDFLEEIEEIVFNLTNNVDLENTKKKMELYQKDNKEVIQKNKLKLTREQEELEEALEVERQESEQRRLFMQKEEQLQQMIKRKNKQALLDDLESSDLPASLLLAQHKDRSTQLEMQLEKPKPVKPVTFSTGIKMGQHISLAPIQKLEETLYEYQPLQVETYGPQVPELEMLGKLGTGLCPERSDIFICDVHFIAAQGFKSVECRSTETCQDLSLVGVTPRRVRKSLFPAWGSKEESELFSSHSQGCLLFLIYKILSPVLPRSSQQDSPGTLPAPRTVLCLYTKSYVYNVYNYFPIPITCVRQ